MRAGAKICLFLLPPSDHEEDDCSDEADRHDGDESNDGEQDDELEYSWRGHRFTPLDLELPEQHDSLDYGC